MLGSVGGSPQRMVVFLWQAGSLVVVVGRLVGVDGGGCAVG
jgi:hypothetical protein